MHRDRLLILLHELDKVADEILLVVPVGEVDICRRYSCLDVVRGIRPNALQQLERRVHVTPAQRQIGVDDDDLRV